MLKAPITTRRMFYEKVVFFPMVNGQGVTLNQMLTSFFFAGADISPPDKAWVFSYEEKSSKQGDHWPNPIQNTNYGKIVDKPPCIQDKSTGRKPHNMKKINEKGNNENPNPARKHSLYDAILPKGGSHAW